MGTGMSKLKRKPKKKLKRKSKKKLRRKGWAGNMKYSILVALLLCASCMPASQQEVVELTGLVREIIPVVREIGGENNEKVERLLTDVERVNEAVATAEIPVEAIREGVKATSDWNPYAVPILAGISLLEALGIFREKKKTAGLEKGINRVKGEAEPQLAKRIHDTMKIYT